MGDTRDPERDQQLPVGNDEPLCHDMVADDLGSRFEENSDIVVLLSIDLEERKAHGTKKYGQPLQPHNGRNFIQDAYEEALDLAVYLRGKLEEIADADSFDPHTGLRYQACYQVHLETLKFLREELDRTSSDQSA